MSLRSADTRSNARLLQLTSTQFIHKHNKTLNEKNKTMQFTSPKHHCNQIYNILRQQTGRVNLCLLSAEQLDQQKDGTISIHTASNELSAGRTP